MRKEKVGKERDVVQKDEEMKELGRAAGNIGRNGVRRR
jgi:hypothetical protein